MPVVKMFGQLPIPCKLVIAGNHNTTFDPEYYKQNATRFHRADKYDPTTVRAALTNCTYLEDEAVEIQGLKIYGSPWQVSIRSHAGLTCLHLSFGCLLQPEFCDWAFNLPRGKACREKWQAIPADTDILITHGPPLGRGDKCNHGDHRAGCEDLLDEVCAVVRVSQSTGTPSLKGV